MANVVAGAGNVLKQLAHSVRALVTGFVDRFSIWVRGASVRRWSQITPHLFVGGRMSRRGWQRMQATWGISAIVNMRAEADDRVQGIVPELYLWLPTRDWRPPSLENLLKGALAIHELLSEGETVYVHCGVGVGRAPIMAAAYLIYIGHTPDEALAIVRRRRPFIAPTRAQRRRLREFSALLQDEETWFTGPAAEEPAIGL